MGHVKTRWIYDVRFKMYDFCHPLKIRETLFLILRRRINNFYRKHLQIMLKTATRQQTYYYLTLLLFIVLVNPSIIYGQQNPLYQRAATAPKVKLLEGANENLKLSVEQQQVNAGETPEGIDECSWTSIQEQIRMGKYKAFPNEEGGYNTANAHHGFHIVYNADGTTQLKPYEQDDTNYHIGMRLAGVGYAELKSLDKPTALYAENIGVASGSKVSYQWNEQITEWWINQENHLEQWFYLKEAPKGKSDEQPLRLRLALDTDMSLHTKKDKLTFSKDSHSINYDKFKAWDATGKALDVQFAQDGNYLDLLIADATATYPLTIDPSFTQQAYLKASNMEGGDRFGVAVAVSGDLLAVGAQYEKSNATGINGDQSNNFTGGGAGAVYVFVRNGINWTQEAYIKAAAVGSNDAFGTALAIEGQTLVVGMALEDSNATGINGDPTDNSEADAGAAYVFVRNGTTWTQQAYLKASNLGGRFGTSVSISGETIVVGASREKSNATGVNGDDTDISLHWAGAAYVFVRTGGLMGVWSQQAYLKPSAIDSRDFFGISVGISGETIVVGASQEQSNATGINGDDTDNTADEAGAAYVFVRSGITWTQQAYLKASNTETADEFGGSVSISGETIVIGARQEDSNGNAAIDAGAVYVYVRSGTTWSQQRYLKASNAGAGDKFGGSVSISGETMVVGASGEDGNGTDAGAAYVLARSGTTWTQQNILRASNADADDEFGVSVSISGATIVVGAPYEDSNAIGVNGDEADNTASLAGAAYVFDATAYHDLSITVNPSTSTENEEAFQIYTVTLNNAGPENATAVKVKVQIPYGRTFITATPSSGSYDPQAELWIIDNVPVGNETLAITFKVD